MPELGFLFNANRSERGAIGISQLYKEHRQCAIVIIAFNTRTMRIHKGTQKWLQNCKLESTKSSQKVEALALRRANKAAFTLCRQTDRQTALMRSSKASYWLVGQTAAVKAL